jgi:hypothetical protein
MIIWVNLPWGSKYDTGTNSRIPEFRNSIVQHWLLISNHYLF